MVLSCGAAYLPFVSCVPLVLVFLSILGDLETLHHFRIVTLRANFTIISFCRSYCYDTIVIVVATQSSYFYMSQRNSRFWTHQPC